MPVYADVLAAVNGFVNYLLLLSAGKILKIRSGGYRLFLSAAMGGLFSLVIFLPRFTFFADLAVKLAMCSLMARAAFGFGGIKSFIRKTAVFFTVSMVYGGLMSAVYSLTGFGGMVYKNGMAYFDIDFKVLALTSIACFTVINLIMKIARAKAPSNSIFDVEIKSGGRSCCGRGLADTGNSLCEMFSGTPVIVANTACAGRIIPAEIGLYLKTGDPDCLNESIRLIPSSTVAGSALLPAFRSDEVTIKSPRAAFVHKNIYIAVCETEFFGGEFEFLLNSRLTEDDTDEKSYCKNKASDKKTDGRRRSLHKRAGNTAGAADERRGRDYISAP